MSLSICVVLVVTTPYWSQIMHSVKSPKRIASMRTATISAPHMHAHCLELFAAHAKMGAKVLDVGSGSGYLCAVFAHMVGPSGKAVGVEHIPQLVELSLQNLRKSAGHARMLEEGTIAVELTDGREGAPRRIELVWCSSDRKVDMPRTRSSSAPMRVKMASKGVRRADSAGTYEPICHRRFVVVVVVVVVVVGFYFVIIIRRRGKNSKVSWPSVSP